MTSTADDNAPDRDPVLPPFLLSIDLVAGRISLHGELDRRHVDRLLESVTVLNYSTSPRWSIDLAGVTFCDTAGLHALVAAQGLAHDAGRTFVVTRPGHWLCRLLRLAGLGYLREVPPATV
jgi:anti-anti-sigma factor